MSRTTVYNQTAPEEPLDLELRIETPENVVLSYQLAGPAVRAAAYLVDWVLRLVILGGATILLLCGSIVSPGFSGGLFLVLLFVSEWLYFAVCEWYFRGKSLGKQVFGLRVIDDRGHPLSFWGSMLRNLLRGVDGIPLYGIGLISILLSKRMQRLGDLAAGTVVISERRVVLPRGPVILDKIEPLPPDSIGHHVPDRRTLMLIDDFLGRREILEYGRGHAMTAPLAAALAQHLHYRGDPELPERYPMAFLARVYVTYIQREEDDEPVDEPPRPRKRRRRRRRAGSW